MRKPFTTICAKICIPALLFSQLMPSSFNFDSAIVALTDKTSLTLWQCSLATSCDKLSSGIPVKKLDIHACASTPAMFSEFVNSAGKKEETRCKWINEPHAPIWSKFSIPKQVITGTSRSIAAATWRQLTKVLSWRIESSSWTKITKLCSAANSRHLCKDSNDNSWPVGPGFCKINTRGRAVLAMISMVLCKVSMVMSPMLPNPLSRKYGITLPLAFAHALAEGKPGNGTITA